MSLDIFLSVGRTYTEKQEMFVTSLENLLRARGFMPRTVGRSDFSSRAPLQRVSELMTQCHGTVVCAFERSRAVVHVEMPGTADEQRRDNVRMPTVWNQIEAAMTYVHQRPLLVIVERGLKDEGLLEERYDWYVQRVELHEQALQTQEFQTVLNDWCGRVEQLAKEGEVEEPDVRETRDLTVGQLLRTMPIRQLWAVIAALITLMAFVAAIAFQAGQASGS